MLIRYETRQMRRTPLRLIALVLALAVMTVMMTVSAGLYLACQSALQQVDAEYITIARDSAPSHTSYGTRNEYDLAREQYRKDKDMFLLHKNKLENVVMYTEHSMYAAYSPQIISRLTADGATGGYSYTVDSPDNMTLLVVRCDRAEELPSMSRTRDEEIPRAGFRMTVEEVVMAHEDMVIAEKLIMQSAVRMEEGNSLPFAVGERYLIWGEYEGGTERFGTFVLGPDCDEQLLLPQVTEDDSGRNLIGIYIKEGGVFGPVAAKLGEMTASEFQRSGDWAAWRDVVKMLEVSIGTMQIFSGDSVLIHESFLNGSARLVAGRDFSAREIGEGARVCVIHTALAEKNGLSVGDTIDLSFYSTTFLDSDHVSNYPEQFYIYTPQNESKVAADSGTYEIVGIYETADQSESIVALHPNTVMVPQSALSTYGRGHPYHDFTLVIPNGGVEALEAELETYGIGKIFRYDDGGYSEVVPHLTMMSESVRSITLLCFGLWVLIAMALVVLHTVMQRTHARVKFCVGVPKGRIWGHTLFGGLLLLFAALLLGTGASLMLYEHVLAKLMNSGFTVFYGAFGARETSDILAQVYRLLQQSPKTICRLGAMQFGVLAAWMMLVSAWFSLRNSCYRK